MHRASRGGFSLLEAVVALAIVGVVAIAVLAAAGQALRGAQRSHAALVAGELARMQLGEVALLPRAILLADPPRTGSFAAPFAGYTWVSAADATRAHPDLVEVDVGVTWPEGRYDLRTILYRPTGPAGP